MTDKPHLKHQQGVWVVLASGNDLLDYAAMRWASARKANQLDAYTGDSSIKAEIWQAYVESNGISAREVDGGADIRSGRVVYSGQVGTVPIAVIDLNPTFPISPGSTPPAPSLSSQGAVEPGDPSLRCRCAIVPTDTCPPLPRPVA